MVIDLDAAGLALFAVSGAGKALAYEIHPFVAVLMGGITGVGGGTVRDVLLTQVPTVLRADVYATAALAGAAVMILGLRFGMPRTLATAFGGVFCCGLSACGSIGIFREWRCNSERRPLSQVKIGKLGRLTLPARFRHEGLTRHSGFEMDWRFAVAERILARGHRSTRPPDRNHVLR